MFCVATLYFIIIGLLYRCVALCLLITHERLKVFLSRLRTTPCHRQASTTRQLPPLPPPTAQPRPQNTLQHMTTATPITRYKHEMHQHRGSTLQLASMPTTRHSSQPTSTPVKVSARVEQDITPADIAMDTSLKLDTSNVS